MEFISEIIRKIPTAGDPDEVLKLCSDLFIHKFNAHNIAIHSYEKESQGMYLLHAHPLLFGKQSIKRYEKTPAFSVAKTLQPVYIEDINHSREYELDHIHNIMGSLSCYPLIMGKELVGVLYLNWKSGICFKSTEDKVFDTLLKLTTIIVHMVNLTIEDSETGLYNRSFFVRCIFNEILRSSRNGHSLSLILIPLSNKNDIQTAGELLKRKLRQTDYIGRIGSTLLACLLPETDCIGSKIAAERLNSYFKEGQLQDNTVHRVTYPDDVVSAEEMLQAIIEMKKEIMHD